MPQLNFLNQTFAIVGPSNWIEDRKVFVAILGLVFPICQVQIITGRLFLQNAGAFIHKTKLFGFADLHVTINLDRVLLLITNHDTQVYTSLAFFALGAIEP